MLRRHRVISAAIVAIGLGTMPAGASELASGWTTDKPETRARLVAGTVSAKPYAGVEIELASGWKTYWRFPGDVGGVPPSFDWAKSDNVASVKVLYPAPKRMVDPLGVTLGYKDQVILPVEVVAKDPAKPVALKLTLDYGICKEVCVPVTAELALDLPPGARADPTAKFLAALDHVPRSADGRRDGDPKLLKAEVKLDGATPMIAIEAEFPGGTAGAQAYVDSPSGNYIPLPKDAAVTDIGPNRKRFEIDLTGATDVADLKGKTAFVTLVSEKGLSETTITLD